MYDAQSLGENLSYGCLSVFTALFRVQKPDLLPHIQLPSTDVFSINSSSRSSPTSACHHPPAFHLNSATQDQSHSHTSVTLTPAPPAAGDELVDLQAAAFKILNKGGAGMAADDPHLMMPIPALGGNSKPEQPNMCKDCEDKYLMLYYPCVTGISLPPWLTHRLFSYTIDSLLVLSLASHQLPSYCKGPQ